MEMTQEQRWLDDLVGNALLARTELIKMMTDPKRDIASECGHPAHGMIAIEDYFRAYDRNCFAARVAEVWAEECWKRSPTAFESEDIDKVTPWEKDLMEVRSFLRGGSAFQDDQQEADPIWDALQELHVKSSIGQFGVALLGLDDKGQLDTPVEGFRLGGYKKRKRELTFIRVLDQRYAEIKDVEENQGDPRFGLPKTYLLKLTEGSDTQTEVHWHRVFHACEGGLVYGVPRMEAVWDRLLDLAKLLGGSAEMYWRGAFPGMTFESHPDAGGDLEIDEVKMRQQISSYMERLQRSMLLLGITAKSHAPQVVDPTPQVGVQLDGICIRMKVPKRIFMGSERGELASTTDSDSWNTRVEGYRRNHTTPKKIVPFFDRMQHLGVTRKPKLYKVDWPSLNVMTDEQAASVAVKKTQAMMLFVTGGVHALIGGVDWANTVLGMPHGKAKQVIKPDIKKLDMISGAVADPNKKKPAAGKAARGVSGGSKDMTKRGEQES